MPGRQSTNVRIVATRPDCKERAEQSCPDPPTITIFDFLVDRDSYLRQFAPEILKRIGVPLQPGGCPPFSRPSRSSGTSKPTGRAGCRRILQSSSSHPAGGRGAIGLWGIDAPETGQDFGNRAEQAASRLTFGQTVTIRPRDTDRCGRRVAEVILPDGR